MVKPLMSRSILMTFLLLFWALNAVAALLSMERHEGEKFIFIFGWTYNCVIYITAAIVLAYERKKIKIQEETFKQAETKAELFK